MAQPQQQIATLQMKHLKPSLKMLLKATQERLASARAAAIKKNHSYQLATQSSKAKNRHSTTSAKDAGGREASNRRSFGRRSLSAGLKNKFKSTPDLMTADDGDKMQGMSPSKTTEDIVDMARIGSDTQNLYLSNMRATRDKRSLFSSTTEAGRVEGHSSPTPSGSSGYVSTSSLAVSAAHNSKFAVQPLTSTASSSPPEQDKNKVRSSERDTTSMPNDALMMPPPANTSIAKNTWRTPVTEITLLQAKEIILGKSSSLTGNRASSSIRRSLPNEGTPAMLQTRPHSAINSRENGPSQDTETEPTRNTSNSSHLHTQTAPRTTNTNSASSKTLKYQSLTSEVATNSNSVTNGASMSESSLVQNATSNLVSPESGQRTSQANNPNQYLDASPMDLPEKDNYVSPGSSRINSHQPADHSNVPSSSPNKRNNSVNSRTDIHLMSSSSSVQTRIKQNGISDKDTVSDPSGLVSGVQGVNNSSQLTNDQSKMAIHVTDLAEERNSTFTVNKDSGVSMAKEFNVGLTNDSGLSVSCLVNQLGRVPSPIEMSGGEPDLAGLEAPDSITHHVSKVDGITHHVSKVDGITRSTGPATNGSSPRVDGETQSGGLVDSHSVLGHLTRRRDPQMYSRSPRQLNNTVTIATGVVSGSANQPPSIPAPLTPPRETGSTNSGSVAPSPRTPDQNNLGNVSGRLSPTKGLSSLNREAMTARWQRAQQNRERQLSSGSQASPARSSGAESDSLSPHGRATSLDPKYLQDTLNTLSPADKTRSVSLEPAVNELQSVSLDLQPGQP